jgi:hypothetical protein
MLMASLPKSAVPPKGRPPLRKCPDDFEVIFVEQGRLGCEAWYRARRDTITRWLVECGKKRLIEARAAFVAHQRANGQWLTRSSRMVETRIVSKDRRTQPVRDRRKISPTVARHAAQYLRVIRNGGFIVSMVHTGDWRVGTKLVSAAQLLDLAISKGFDPDVGDVCEDPGVHAKAPGNRSLDNDSRNTWGDDWRQRWHHENGNADFQIGRDWQGWEGDDLGTDLHPLSGRQVKSGHDDD